MQFVSFEIFPPNGHSTTTFLYKKPLLLHFGVMRSFETVVKLKAPRLHFLWVSITLSDQTDTLLPFYQSWSQLFIDKAQPSGTLGTVLPICQFPKPETYIHSHLFCRGPFPLQLLPTRAIHLGPTSPPPPPQKKKNHPPFLLPPRLDAAAARRARQVTINEVDEGWGGT